MVTCARFLHSPPIVHYGVLVRKKEMIVINSLLTFTTDHNFIYSHARLRTSLEYCHISSEIIPCTTICPRRNKFRDGLI